MSLSTREIQRVVVEARRALVGATLREVAQLEPETFAFRFRCGEAERYLCIGLAPGLSRVHLMSGWTPSPKSKHPLFLFLKSHLAEAVLEAVEQLQEDRIVELRFGGEAPRLVAELTGSMTNLVCVSGDGEILEALRHERLREREILPHRAYELPPRPASSRAAEQDRFVGVASPSAAIEAAYETLTAEARSKELRARLLSILTEAGRRAERKVTNIEQSIRLMSEGVAGRQKGELLKAHLDEIPKGARQIELADSSGALLRITLEPRLSAVENMQRYFERAKRAARGLEPTARRLAAARRELERLSSLLGQLEAAASLDALRELESEMISARLVRPPKERPGKPAAAGPRRFLSADGLEILVGRSNEQNDHLTLHVARGNDLWLHVQAMAGSHVIVRTPPGKTVPKESLLDAANLAVYYSKARHSKGAFVDYVQRKHVRKPKGSRPGYVTFAHNKTLIIEPEPERLKRLLATAGEPDEPQGSRQRS